MSSRTRLKASANSAGYPTLAEARLARRAFLFGAGAVAAAAVAGCGAPKVEMAGGALPEPHPDASATQGAPDAGLPNALSGAAPAEEPDAGP